MINRRHFSFFQKDDIEVTRQEGSRGADGFQGSSTTTVLSSKGNAQQVGREVNEQPTSFSAGDIVFFSSDSVDPVEVSDTVTIHTKGRVINGTVEDINLDQNSLIISLDG